MQLATSLTDYQMLLDICIIGTCGVMALATLNRYPIVAGILVTFGVLFCLFNA